MRLTKAVFTTIEDIEGVKTTVVVEYGPFEEGEEHQIQALINYLDKLQEDDTCQTTKIIT